LRPSTSTALPDPDPAARVHSERVLASVRDVIAGAGGWIPFSAYMQHVLYAPGLGYYAAGARKFGADGDFVTAPEMTPLFARALAAPVADILAATATRDVVELGAGSGALAADLLATLAAKDALPGRYRILEVSPDLRARQQAALAHRVPDLAARVEWLDAMPASIDGAVLMNEVLDAVPPHVIARRGGAWFERGVACDGRLQWQERPLADEALVALARERFPAAGDYASEVNPAAEALVATLAQRMTGGAMLAIDYGFPEREYYHPDRREGTLMAHYRHRALADPFLWPGLCDLTAHVDFTAMAVAGEHAGLTVDGYAPLAGFLLGSGILDRLREVGDPTSIPYVRAAAAVQTLLSPAEMGELFKVLALAKRGGIVASYFAAADRTHRL
jgi:SAM-dependent MidA family methyltransferase